MSKTVRSFGFLVSMLLVLSIGCGSSASPVPSTGTEPGKPEPSPAKQQIAKASLEKSAEASEADAAATTTPVKTAADEYVIVLDASGSMNEKMGEESKIALAQKAFADLLEKIPASARLGIVVFGHRLPHTDPKSCEDIEVLAPVGEPDRAALKTAIEAVKARGETPIGSSLEQAASLFSSDARKTLVLLSDGKESCGADPAAVIRKLRDSGIDVIVHTIGFGVDEETKKQLEAIAEAGGGKYFDARSGAELGSVLQEAAGVAEGMLNQCLEEVTGRKVVLRETFDGDAIPTGWQVLNRDDNRIAVDGGKLLIVTQYRAPWAENDKIANLVRSTKPVSLPDYEFSSEIRFQPQMQHHGVAIQLQQNDSNYIELQYYADPHGYNLWRRFRIVKVLDGEWTQVSVSGAIGAAKTPLDIVLKIVKKGINFYGYATYPDPESGKVSERLIGVQTAPTITSPRLVLKAANGASDHYGSGKVSEIDAEFDNVTLTRLDIARNFIDRGKDPNAVYQTNFLDRRAFEREFIVHNPDPRRMGFACGLNLVSRYGLLGNNRKPAVPNLVEYKGQLPDGDWDVIAQLTTRLTTAGNSAGFALIQDTQTMLTVEYASLEHGYNQKRRLRFGKLIGTEWTVLEDPAYRFGGSPDWQDVLLKIEKRGRKYTAFGYFKNEKSGKWEWIKIGEQTLLKFHPRLHLYAANFQQDHYGYEKTHEIVGRFSRLLILKR